MKIPLKTDHQSCRSCLISSILLFVVSLVVIACNSSISSAQSDAVKGGAGSSSSSFSKTSSFSKSSALSPSAISRSQKFHSQSKQLVQQQQQLQQQQQQLIQQQQQLIQQQKQQEVLAQQQQIVEQQQQQQQQQQQTEQQQTSSFQSQTDLTLNQLELSPPPPPLIQSVVTKVEERTQSISSVQGQSDSEPTIYGAVQGVPGVDFPGYTSIPITKFSCDGRPYEIGMYADEETGCQVSHSRRVEFAVQ